MNIAYVISAYKLPGQLARLVHRLSAPETSFTIHVDRRTPRPVDRAMRDAVADVPAVRFLPRHRCYWGGFGPLRSTLKAIDDLLERRVAFDYMVLLTGQDYPLRSAGEIAAALSAAAGTSFMSSWPLPHAEWDGRGGLDRAERWHLVGPRGLHVSVPRRRSLGLAFRGGSTYWCLARPLVEHVHSVMRARPEIVRYFEHAYLPDELFFQTLLGESAHAASIVDDNLRYVDWSTTPAPKILTMDDLPALLASAKLFARKFDETVDADVLDALDVHVSRTATAVSS
jgi:hypothetical protein